jgi:hypothetical protein
MSAAAVSETSTSWESKIEREENARKREKDLREFELRAAQIVFFIIIKFKF